MHRGHQACQQRRPPVPGEHPAQEVDERRDRDAEHQRNELGGGHGLAKQPERSRREEWIERAPVRVRLRQVRRRQIQVLEDVGREAGACGDVVGDIHIATAVAVRPGKTIVAEPHEAEGQAQQRECAQHQARRQPAHPAGGHVLVSSIQNGLDR